jgi:demethoxyubiquinone hydroxylase (CLK1/Coq7/Cat5 family)
MEQAFQARSLDVQVAEQLRNDLTPELATGTQVGELYHATQKLLDDYGVKTTYNGKRVISTPVRIRELLGPELVYIRPIRSRETNELEFAIDYTGNLPIVTPRPGLMRVVPIDDMVAQFIYDGQSDDMQVNSGVIVVSAAIWTEKLREQCEQVAQEKKTARKRSRKKIYKKVGALVKLGMAASLLVGGYTYADEKGYVTQTLERFSETHEEKMARDALRKQEENRVKEVIAQFDTRELELPKESVTVKLGKEATLVTISNNIDLDILKTAPVVQADGVEVLSGLGSLRRVSDLTYWGGEPLKAVGLGKGSCTSLDATLGANETVRVVSNLVGESRLSVRASQTLIQFCNTTTEPIEPKDLDHVYIQVVKE